MKKRRPGWPLGTWLAAVILVASLGCDERLPLAPSPIRSQPVDTRPSPSPPGSDIVPAAAGGVGGVYMHPITPERSGNATVTLSWPNADVSLSLYLTTDDCGNSASLVAGSCNVLGYARPGNPPTMLSVVVTQSAKYIVWVLNPDPIPQPVFLAVDVR